MTTIGSMHYVGLVHKKFVTPQNPKTIVDKNSKYFRYKKRYSFLSKSKLFRIDLTIVKSTTKHQTIKFIDSGVINSNKKFEVEIEFLGISETVFNSKEKPTAKEISLDLSPKS